MIILFGNLLFQLIALHQVWTIFCSCACIVFLGLVLIWVATKTPHSFPHPLYFLVKGGSKLDLLSRVSPPPMTACINIFKIMFFLFFLPIVILHYLFSSHCLLLDNLSCTVRQRTGPLGQRGLSSVAATRFKKLSLLTGS